MNYTRNLRPKRVNFTELRHKDSQMQGFKVGVLAMAWIMKESYEIDADEIREMVDEALDFVGEIGKGHKDPTKVNEIMTQMTGINILLGE
jgi:hypothetical protein